MATQKSNKLYLLVVSALIAACQGSSTPSPSHSKPAPVISAHEPSDALATVEGQTPDGATRSTVVIQGSGSIVGTPATSPEAPAGEGEGFQLNFVNTEISAVVTAVLGDGLGAPFVIDPQIKGTMTLQATRPLSKDEILVALEAALRAQGAALVDINGVYNVVPSKDAVRQVSSLRMAADGAKGYGIYVVPLQFVAAAEMEKILQPFAREGGILRVDEARNLLLLAGTSQELGTLLNVVKTFDVDWLAGMSFGLYPLNYVDAKTAAGELGEIFGGNKSPIAGVVRFVPLGRLNTLLVVTPQIKYLSTVEEWIKRLDLGVTTPGRRIYVYDVQNGKADDLANSLNKILSLSTDDSGSGGEVRSSTDGGSTGRSSTMSGTTSSVASGTTSTAPPAVRQPVSRSGGGTALEENALKIVPNAENNSLLILASPGEFSIVEAALKKLDVLPIQILVEASIAEVTLTDDLRYGLQWSYQGGDGPLILSEASTGTINQKFPGFSYLFTGRTDIRAVLNAIESLTNVRVLSSPKLLVLNNRDAQLQIGDQVPVAVQSSVGTNNPGSPIVNSVQLRDTGVILRVTPRANKSGRVILEIVQEVSDVVPTTTSTIDSPTIQQRKMSSTVAVADGETIALGGLIRENRSRGRSGVPYLRRIPLLGNAFGSTSNNSTRTELIVLITPHVIRSEEESRGAMDDLREQFKGLRRVVPQWKKSPVNDNKTQQPAPAPQS